MLSMVLFSIFSVYSSGIRIWKTARDIQFTKNRKIFTAISKMRKEITAYIRDFEDIEAVGDKESVRFPVVDEADILEIVYFYDKGKDAIIREEIKFSDSLKDKMNTKKTILFQADDVEFSYLYGETTEESGGWMSSFSEEEHGFPNAVKLSIRNERKNFSKTIFIPS